MMGSWSKRGFDIPLGNLTCIYGRPRSNRLCKSFFMMFLTLDARDVSCAVYGFGEVLKSDLTA